MQAFCFQCVSLFMIPVEQTLCECFLLAITWKESSGTSLPESFSLNLGFNALASQLLRLVSILASMQHVKASTHASAFLTLVLGGGQRKKDVDVGEDRISSFPFTSQLPTSQRSQLPSSGLLRELLACSPGQFFSYLLKRFTARILSKVNVNWFKAGGTFNCCFKKPERSIKPHNGCQALPTKVLKSSPTGCTGQ